MEKRRIQDRNNLAFKMGPEVGYSVEEEKEPPWEGEAWRKGTLWDFETLISTGKWLAGEMSPRAPVR